MKKFLNKLTDGVIIVNDKRNIIFANTSFLKNIGEVEKEVNIEEINKQVKINNNEIIVTCNDEVIKDGIVEFSSIQWQGEAAEAVTVKWNKHLGDSTKLNLVEQLLDHIMPWMSIKNINNEYVYINQACADFYNTTKSKAKSIMKNQFLESSFREFSSKKDEYIIKHKKVCSYEVEEERDGVKFYYEIKKYPILNDLGEVEYIGSSVRDISLQKNIQYNVLEKLDIIDGIDENGHLKMNKVDEYIFKNFKMISEKFLKVSSFNIFIYNEDEKCVKPVFPVILAEKSMIGIKAIPILQEDIEKYFNGTYEKITTVEDIQLEKDHEINTYYIVNYPIIIQGEFKGIVAMSYREYPVEETIENGFIKTMCSEIAFIIKYIELSQRIYDELTYRMDLEKELEAFLEVSADFVLKTTETEIRDTNDKCFHVLGWTKDEFINMKPEDIIHPEDIDRVLALMKKQSETNERLEWSNRVKCADGTYKWITWRNRNFMQSRGFIFSSGRDITNEKEMELKEKQYEKAKQLEEVRNEFFANISHEFKTPINMIMATSQLMMHQLQGYDIDKIKEIEMKKHINIFRQNAYRLLRLVNNLIDITKIDSGFYKIKPSNVNIISVVEDIVLSVVNYCEGNKIQLIFDTETEEEVIACDPDQIERVILNLLSNAIKYTPEYGLIDVNIQLEEEYVVIKVKDTGTGIPRERLEVIFERFVQCEETFTRPCEGSGIGLSLVKGIVEMHGGEILVSSEEGVGSTFEVRLPRKQVEIHSIDGRNQEIKQSKIEKCSIEFADIYNL